MSEFFPSETEDTVVLEEQYQKLKGLFAAYIHDSDELYANQKTGMGETVKRYVNMDDLRNSPIHKKFYQDVEACVQSVAEGLEKCPSQELARSAAELFFRRKEKDMEASQRSWLIAVEGLAISLVPYLSHDDALFFCEEYEKQYRWAEMMPKQRDLYNALCEAAGKEKRRRGFFDSFLSNSKKKER